MATDLRPLALIAVLFSLNFVSVDPAGAHDLGLRHRAIATARADATGLTVEVLLIMEVRKGLQADRLLLRFDLDRDGDLNPIEARALSSELGPQAVGGYVLRLDGRPAAPAAVESRASRTAEGGLIVALLMRYSAPRSQARVEVAVLKTPRGRAGLQSSPIAVELQAEAPLTIARASGALAPDAPILGPVSLRPGADAAWIEVALAPREPAP